MLRDHRALECEFMPGWSSDAFGEIQTYADFVSRGHGKRHRITKDRRPAGNCYRIASAKGDSLNRAGFHPRQIDRHRNSGRVNEER